MADARTYIRVHDGMDEHPKIAPLSDAGFRLLVSAWCYCSRNLTDGQIVDAIWRKRGTAKARKELADAGLVEQREGYVVMHDYLEHQRSADEVAEMRRKRAEAGKKGGRSKANRLASATADAKHEPEQVLKQTAKQTASKNVASTEEVTYVTSQTDPSSLRSEGAAQKRATRISDDFEPEDPLRQWARDRGFTDPQIDEVTAQFVRYWRAKSGRDATKRDWPATWQNWVAKEDPQRVRIPRLTAIGDRRFTGDELDQILGADRWTCPEPPPGLDPDQQWEWRRDRQIEHIEDRQQQARDRAAVRA